MPDHAGERLAEGREAEVFLQPDGTVLKLWRDPGSGDRARRESAALTALRSAACRVPASLGTVEVAGRPGLLLERVEGEDLLALLGRRPLSVLSVGRAMARAHLALHGPAAPDELPELHDLLRERIARAETLPDDLRARAQALLDDLPRGDRICHGDLHPGNMLGSTADPVVIDWGDASRGDPTADVARSELLLRMGELPPGSPVVMRTLARIGRGLLITTYLGGYRRGRALDRAQLDRWLTVRAAARLSEGIPEEVPRLLRLLDTAFGG
jgi:aminoglycoside phosphotransferase (APT) family kinase protein